MLHILCFVVHAAYGKLWDVVGMSIAVSYGQATRKKILSQRTD